jgi:hypothetical protein
VITTGLKVVWSIPTEIKPLFFGLPIVGKVQLRFRARQAAKAFIKEPDGIRCFILEDFGDHWQINPRLERGRNARLG